MEFINSILPGNYWLTKSMEFVKINSSGTLWYLKKWIVYYYYIFMKKNILYQEDYEELTEIFESFINSLEEKVRDNARKFFFDIDIKSDNFTKFRDFIATVKNFTNEKEHDEFLLNAKKFYFVYIMNIGGQAGNKKFIKEKIIEGNSYEKVLELLLNKLQEEGKNNKFNELVSDFHAALRNERQIFFYYGFFHGKECADLSGFYNLTNIGKTIIKANNHELLLLWEHQKLKMVSQSPIAEIQNLNTIENINYEKFSILPHPYFVLLMILCKKQVITTYQYQFIISKINKNSDLENVINNILGVKNIESKCIEKAKSFNRKSEIESEDFSKEIKKFILGICNLPKDNECNYFQFTSWIKENKISITNKDRADFIVCNYNKIIEYLDKKYLNLYNLFDVKLREKYLTIINNKTYILEDDVKYEWNKYIINFDKNIYLNLIYIAVALKNNCFDYSIEKEVLYENYNNYKFILTLFGITKVEYRKLILDIQTLLSYNNLLELEEIEKEEITIDPKRFTEEITENKLLEISRQSVSENKIYASISRKRNRSLIEYLRCFYFNNYSDKNSKFIKCDCCGSVTFLTNNGYPYLEFHHLIPFSTDFGPDHYLNIFGICPNCHKKLHFINKEEKKSLYKDLSLNNNMHKDIIFRINNLYNENILEPINIDFLKKEKIISDEQYDKLVSNPPI